MFEEAFIEETNQKKIYAKADNDGNIVAFYDETFPAETLEGCVEISHDDWQACLKENWCRKVVDGQIVEVTEPPSPTAEELAARIRKVRNRKLAQTDWWAVSDMTMTQEQIDYRQALRDITEQTGFPENIDWPQIPGTESEKPE